MSRRIRVLIPKQSIEAVRSIVRSSFFFLGCLLLLPVMAHAQSGSPFETGFANMQTLFTGTVAKVYTDDGNRLEKDLARDVSKSAAIETKSQKENTMNFQNEQADKREPSKESQRMPIEIYASSLSPENVREDVRFAERQLEQGLSRPESVRNLTGDHVRRTEAEPSTLSLAERYTTHITELVRHLPEQSTEKVLEILQPSLKDVVHWEPAIKTLGASQSDSLLWRREHGDIQSYQQSAESRGWLHIDSAGQFFDRSAQAITSEQALSPLGLTDPEAFARERGQAEDISKQTGVGMSL